MNNTQYLHTIRYDFHVHSAFSEDADTPMQQMVEKAIEHGLSMICFTEHVDFDWPEGQGTFLVDQNAYFQEINRLRGQYNGQIHICSGAELGMQPQTMQRCVSLAGQYPFDFLIASQHLLSGQDPYYATFWEGADPDLIIRSYFETVYANLQQMPEFDTLGHLDYICRYVPDPSYQYDWERFADVIDPILTYLIHNDTCLEVNSGGLRKNGMANPCEGVLMRYRQLGGHLITVGSDAHTPEDIARPFPQLHALLKRCGFDHVCTFAYDSASGKRIRTEHTL